MVSTGQELEIPGEDLSRFRVKTSLVYFMARGVMIGELGDREGGFRNKVRSAGQEGAVGKLEERNVEAKR